MDSDEEQSFEWTPYAELRLLHSLYGLKPIGVSHHFMMIVIWEKFKKSMGVDVSLHLVKEKLQTYYNFEAANDALNEEMPFPHQEFSLPESDFPQVQAAGSYETPRKKTKS